MEVVNLLKREMRAKLKMGQKAWNKGVKLQLQIVKIMNERNARRETDS